MVLHYHPGVLASFGSLKKAKRKGRTKDFQKARAAAREEWAEHAVREGSKD